MDMSEASRVEAHFPTTTFSDDIDALLSADSDLTGVTLAEVGAAARTGKYSKKLMDLNVRFKSC